MTDWFRNTVIAAALLLIAFAFGFSVWIVRRRARQRSERLRLERDVIELEQRALRLQMNPHFIFNTLNAIQGLIARDDSRSARQSLSRFSRLMREILQNSREERISLAEEFETLEHYLELAQFTHENLFHYSLNCDDDAAACEVPPLLLQPFVENAILHGLVPAGGGELIVSAQLIDEQRLRLVVEDNGVGMAAAAKTNETHRSAGLSVTLGRLQLFGRNKLWFEEPEKGGTRVVIELFVDENAVS
jgi:sensor histidine kinase YesM